MAVGAGCCVAVVGTLVLFGSQGYPATRPHLLSGAAWLASSQAGQLTLLDGSSAEVAAQVQVAPPGTGLAVVQQGAAAYAVNTDAGSVRRVDGATFAVSQPVVPLPDAGRGLDVFAGADMLYALDTHRGLLSGADPRTLAGRGGPVSLAAQVDPQAAALDRAGRLWLLDTATGDLIWVQDGQRHTRRAAVRTGAGMLVLADEAAVVVDPVARTATTFDPHSGATRGTTELDLRPDDRIAVTGASTSARLYVVAARGVLGICDLTATTCPTVVPVGGAGADLGAAVESGGRVFVPDYATGQVWIVDPDAGRVVTQSKVLDPRVRFQLLSQDGVVFFNDPGSERAGVIRLDGGVQKVSKYTPGHPAGSAASGGEGTKAQQPKTKPVDPGQPKQPPGGREPAAVQIEVSTTQPRVNEDIGLGLAVADGPPPVSARWDFGDGDSGTGVSVLHRWKAAGSYLVTVQAMVPGKGFAVASVTLDVTVRPPVVGTVSVTASGGGMVTSQPAGIFCSTTCDAEFGVGSSVVLTASTGAGTDFAGWGGACGGTAPTCTVTVRAGVTSVSARFTGKPKLRTTSNGKGTISGAGISCRDDCVTALTSGQTVTLTATPDPNFGFTGWGGACSGTGSCTVTMTGDTTVTAGFRSLGPLPAPVLISPADRAAIPHTIRLEKFEVTMTWAAVAGADHYILEFQTISFQTGKVINDDFFSTRTTTGQELLDCTFPTEGPLQQWRVTAFAKDGTRGQDSPWRLIFCGPPSM
jgi:Divergent InlB B-repeat domain/PKD domain